MSRHRIGCLGISPVEDRPVGRLFLRYNSLVSGDRLGHVLLVGRWLELHHALEWARLGPSSSDQHQPVDASWALVSEQGAFPSATRPANDVTALEAESILELSDEVDD